MNEDEIKAKEEDLKTKEEELKAKEEELKAKEEDVTGLVGTMTAEYEKKLSKQKDDFAKKLKERESVIKQLLNGNGPSNKEPTPIEELNAIRQAQKHC